MKFHPASLLLVWTALVLLLQQATLNVLQWLALPAVVFALILLRPRTLRLLRRSRWVFLAMLIMFVWGTPGEYVPGLPLATWEGLQSAAEHGLRLLLLLLLLAGLLEVLNAEDLVAGLHALLLPLRIVGLDRNRVAVRLLLVLRYIESPPMAQGWRHWLEPVDPVPTRLHLVAHRLAWQDYCLLGVSTLLVAGHLLT